MKRIPRSKSALVAAVGLSLVGVLAGCASTTSASSTASGSSGTSSSTSGSSGSTSATSTSDDSSSSSTGTGSTSYKNGTYTTDETYTSPGGQEEIAVTVTVKNNLVSAVIVKTITAEGDGAHYQARFESAISSTVVGKSLRSLSVSRVTGSSLTSEAFNSALDTLRSDAAA